MSGYIGNTPVPQSTQVRETFIATASQTSFATAGYTPGFLDVYLNGVKLINGTDFTATNSSDVVLTTGAAVSDTVEVVAYGTFETNSQTFTGVTTISELSDGTDTVETGYVINGSAKAWGMCDNTGASRLAGTLNVSSVTDSGIDGKDFNLTSALTTAPLAALGAANISAWSNTSGFLSLGVAGITSSLVSTRYYSGAAYTDTFGSFLAHGDLA